MGMLDLFREWVEQSGGKNRPRSRKGLAQTGLARTGLVSLEELESRVVLSPMLTGTTLEVDGTGGNDAISITQNAAGVTVIINSATTSYGSSTTINAINVVGEGGDEQITINSVFNTTALTVNGGAGDNTLISPGQNNLWVITGPNSGTLNGNPFTNIENLTGGGFNDDFQFASNGFVQGSVDGGGGVDTLDYSTRNVGAIVNLAAMSATAIGGQFANINNFHGSADNSDTLIGLNTANVWHISGPSSGDINGQFFFTGVENLVGGTSSDAFVFGATGIVGGTITGGGGNDTIDYSNLSSPIVTNLELNTSTLIAAGFNQIGTIIGSSNPTNLLIGINQSNVWNITSPNSGTVNSVFTTTNFQNFQNLTGGTGGDRFKFYDGAFISGALSGGGGFDTLDYSPRTSAITINLQSSTATAIGGGFTSIEAVVGSASTSDVLIAPDTANNINITGPNSGNVNGTFEFSSIENLTGGKLNDSFNFFSTAFISGAIDGGQGTNTIDYSNRFGFNGSGVVVNLTTSSATSVGGGFRNVSNFVGTPKPGGNAALEPDTLIGPGAALASLAASVTPTSTSFVVTSSSSLRLGQQLQIDNEIVLVTGITGTTITVSRAQTGTAAVSHAQGADIFALAPTQNLWTITGLDTGNVNSQFNYSNFENLTGGRGSDIFHFQSTGSVSGTINGGPIPSGATGGGDWLDYSSLFTPVTVNLATGVGTSVGKIVNVQNVRGSNGVNTLTGNIYGNTLVGGDAADTLISGSGRSVLIGGLGSDKVTGGAGQDILIDGYTNYDSNFTALNSILAEWQSADSLAVRVNDLRNGGGLNGNNDLVADSSVHTDQATNTITAGVGPDWLWGQPAELKNVSPQDIIDVPIHDQPILTNPDNVTFNVGQFAVPVDSGIQLTSTTSPTMASATVQFGQNYNASQDQLGFSPTSKTGNITGSFNSATGTLTLTSLNATATVAQFQLALSQVTYNNTSATPNTGIRSVVFQASDGHLSSNTLTCTVAVNYPPVLSGSSTLHYQVLQAPTVINPNITVTDPDNNTLMSATVQITTFYQSNQDILSFVGNSSTGNIVGSFNSATGVLTLTSAGAPATVAQYQAALRLVTYQDFAGSPLGVTRTVAYQVSDGFANSNVVTSQVVWS